LNIFFEKQFESVKNEKKFPLQVLSFSLDGKENSFVLFASIICCIEADQHTLFVSHGYLINNYLSEKRSTACARFSITHTYTFKRWILPSEGWLWC